MKLQNYYRRGFNSIDGLMACFIVTVIIQLTLTYQQYALKIIKSDEANTISATMRIQKILAQSNIIQISDKSIILEKDNESLALNIDRQRVVRQPGYYILKVNVKGSFEVKNECIYLEEKLLYCEKGIR